MAILNATSKTYKADATGGKDSTTAINNVIEASMKDGSIVYLPSGTYLVEGNLIAEISGRPIQITGDGWGQTVISFTGSGDCFRSYCPGLYSTDTIFGAVPAGGSITGITIDGTNHGGEGGSAIHVGDLLQYNINVDVQNFYQPGDKGVWFDNQYWWTEQLYGKIFASNCASHVVFDNNGDTNSTGSFERCDLAIFIDQNDATFDGVVFQNGTYIADGALAIEGNFTGANTDVESAVLRFTGAAPDSHADAGAYSNIINSRLNVGVECDAPESNTTPYTIYFQTSDNYILNCTGIMDFMAAPAAFQQCNIPGSVSNFTGPILGDTSLVAS